MLRREGWAINHKRVHRLYRLDGLQLRVRVRRRKHQALHRGPVPRAKGRMERLSMDFVHDQMLDGRPFRILTVIDQWSREALLVEPRGGYSGVAVAELLTERLRDGPMPASITVDHGTEFTSKALEQWAGRRVLSSTSNTLGKLLKTGMSRALTGDCEMNA